MEGTKARRRFDPLLLSTRDDGGGVVVVLVFFVSRLYLRGAERKL